MDVMFNNNYNENHDVCVAIPRLWVNVNERHKHEFTNQYLKISYDKLVFVSKLMMRIENALTYNDNLKILNEIIEILTKDCTSNNIYKVDDFSTQTQEERQQNKQLFIFIFDALKQIYNSTEDIMIHEPINLLNTKPICFDEIRQYITDNELFYTLKSYSPTSYQDCYVYNVIPESHHKFIRELNNDTDLNRMYYVISIVIETLLLNDDRIVDNSIKLINFTLTFIILISYGEPIPTHFEMDTGHNLLGYAVDLFIRSRLIEKWNILDTLNTSKCNLKRAYDPKSFMSQLCSKENPKERVRLCLEIMQSNNVMNLPLTIDAYDEYIDICNKFTFTNDNTNETYFKFNFDFISEFIKMRSINVVKKILQTNALNARDDDNNEGNALLNDVIKNL